MNIDYRQVVSVLAEEVAYAKSLVCQMENPLGYDEQYFIKDIAFHIICNQNAVYKFINAYLEEDGGGEKDFTIMIRIWINNENKIYQSNFCFNQIPLQPQGLKIFLRSLIHSLIMLSVKNFFDNDNQKSKYARLAPNPPEQYLQTIEPFDDKINDSLLANLTQCGRKLYSIKRLIAPSVIELSKYQHVKIVVDSDGRKILESGDYYTLTFNNRYLNKQYLMLNLSDYYYDCKLESLAGRLPVICQDVIAKLNSYQRIGFLDRGIYPIVFTPQSTYTLFHEALVGHLCSGDLIVNGQSTYFKNFLKTDLAKNSDGFKILKKLIISVNPTKNGYLGCYNFDHEGVRAQPTVLFKNGILHHYLLSRNSAWRLNYLSNGHARAARFCDYDSDGQLYTVLPEARISHLEIDSVWGLGQKKFFQTIGNYCQQQRCDFYLEITATDGRLNAETGVFSIVVDDCRKIYLNGRPPERIYRGTLSGTPTDFLSGIKAISLQKEQGAAFCGANSGYVPVSYDVPWLFLTAEFVPEDRPEHNRTFVFKRDKYVPN